MEIKELLDDESLDPKKFFDEKEYSTVIVNRDGFTKKENDVADLLETLVSRDTSRVEAEEIFSKLKDSKAQQMIVDTIRTSQNTEVKSKLVAACWESGLDFADHFLFFTELACSPNFQVAMEALTVLENIEEKVDEATLTKALEIAQNSENSHQDLIQDVINTIRARIS